ncbi:prostate stem cell antigen [Patagioenas fasciata monilis]|uniref:Prostate stem cell antigen n=1 Tax=Patagioenas fasciata monilis TaxID=372326 RepID=A0A1V4JVU7_PATFA|nr:prostate stem cell antigen [Patagioenas fasciata monilis]
MKTFLVLLLGAILCLDSGSSLQCYSCKLQIGSSNCQKKEDCKDEKFCKTEVIKIKGFFSLISKGCDLKCDENLQDFGPGLRNVSCCNTNLCNVNAAGIVRSSYGIAAGITATVLWTFLSNGL